MRIQTFLFSSLMLIPYSSSAFSITKLNEEFPLLRWFIPVTETVTESTTNHDRELPLPSQQVEMEVKKEEQRRPPAPVPKMQDRKQRRRTARVVSESETQLGSHGSSRLRGSSPSLEGEPPIFDDDDDNNNDDFDRWMSPHSGRRSSDTVRSHAGPSSLRYRGRSMELDDDTGDGSGLLTEGQATEPLVPNSVSV